MKRVAIVSSHTTDYTIIDIIIIIVFAQEQYV